MGNAGYERLTLLNMIEKVLNTMNKSSPRVRFSTYSRSYLIHSWKSDPARRVQLDLLKTGQTGANTKAGFAPRGAELILGMGAGARADD